MDPINEQLKAIFNAGLDAVKTDSAVKRWVKRRGNTLVINHQTYKLDSFKRIFIVGAGKGVAPMAGVLKQILGDYLYRGMVIVKNGHAGDLDAVEVVEAGHPHPDQAGFEASRRLAGMVEEATADDLVFCLITGGASSLLTLPIDGITLEDKQTVTHVLLECGADIQEINTIRKHLSGIKAGQLAKKAYPAQVITLIVSDVIGNQYTDIGSGPTAPDHTTFQSCWNIITSYGLEDRLPANVIRRIEAGVHGRIPETPKENDPVFERVNNMIVADNLLALQAAQTKAERLGYNTLILSSALEGESRQVARFLAAIAMEVRQTHHPIAPPACLIIGGETTVQVKGSGKGGRNQELALAMALSLKAADNIYALCAGSDGSDGMTDAAGAIIDNTTVGQARSEKRDPWMYLNNNDSYNFFKPMGNLVITGPTLTNVMDINIMIIP
ncbi:TtuD [Desulforapulum autotrophicum HRM2]|uniref:glycerate 2-kinase n=1 Tax=Desulforapulum autotrophicum (strain ATCC 43914 / DSM 3382 / VKM B-1955 / HRM2) TaxID=177437 RepID=C0QCA4_DESAH|nr:glycerate kinase [Desulforapulum autotrophicum]ACN17121.1 TtuD [Desulforapulum autotrophicum HRM2]